MSLIPWTKKNVPNTNPCVTPISGHQRITAPHATGGGTCPHTTSKLHPTLVSQEWQQPYPSTASTSPPCNNRPTAYGSISLHKKVFHVSSDNLAVWSNFIIHQSSSGRINTANGSVYQLDPVALQQENLDSIVHQMISSSTDHDSSSIEARIDEEVRKSVVGRDEESKDCSNGVENYFLNDNENCKESEEEFNRVKVFEHVLRQIPLEILPTTNFSY
jgi:hypothetical protein